MSTQAHREVLAFVVDPPPPYPCKIPPNCHYNEIHFNLSLDKKFQSLAFYWDSSTESERSNKAPPNVSPLDPSINVTSMPPQVECKCSQAPYPSAKFQSTVGISMCGQRRMHQSYTTQACTRVVVGLCEASFQSSMSYHTRQESFTQYI